MKGMGSDPDRDSFFRAVLRLLRRDRVPFLVGGGYAFAVYTDIRRDTKDLDIFVRPEDAPRAIEAGQRAGYKSWIKSPHWLGKIVHAEYFIDIIFSSGNGACPVDDGWFEHAPTSSILGAKVGLTPIEEMIWSKAFIMERHRYDGADIAHLIRVMEGRLDWDRLIWRFGDAWPVLLSHLMLFRYIYPENASDVPGEVLARLIVRMGEEKPAGHRQQPGCRGTLLSYLEYLPDVRAWGYRDARLKPGGTMSRREIERWTSEPK